MRWPADRVRTVLTAAAGAGVLSGLPSTALALLGRHDVLDATRAAGTLLPGRHHRPALWAGAVAHGGITLFWTVLIDRASRGRRIGSCRGGLIGLGIAVLDLEVVGRRYPAVRALPPGPQIADHIAFGLVIAAILDRERDRAMGARPRPAYHRR